VVHPVSNRNMMLFVALALFAATAQSIPEHPDFSGRWVIDTPAVVDPDTPRQLVVVQPIIRRNVLGESMKPAFLRIAIHREGAFGHTDETRVMGAMGGTVPGLSKAGLAIDNSTRVETVWRRDSLVLANLSYGPGGPGSGDWTERREEWSLQRDGRLRVERSVESWTTARRVDVSFYRRESSPR
jgi:hypothetical protein